MDEEACNNCGHQRDAHVMSARAYPSLPGMQPICSPVYISEFRMSWCGCGGFEPIILCKCGHRKSAHRRWDSSRPMSDFACAMYLHSQGEDSHCACVAFELDK